MRRVWFVVVLAMTACGVVEDDNLSAWNKRYDDVFNYQLRQYCMATRDSRQRLEQHMNLLQSYGDSRNAELLWNTYIRSSGRTENDILFCQGRDIVRRDPDGGMCLSFEHMHPSKVGAGVDLLLGSFDRCKETRKIE